MIYGYLAAPGMKTMMQSAKELAMVVAVVTVLLEM